MARFETFLRYTLSQLHLSKFMLGSFTAHYYGVLSMQQLTDYGQGVVNDLANRYGLSNDTILTMLYAVMNGNGTMAQFNCQELGGSGQWMQGGMTMVGDMFNHGLKATVDNLCYELSGILANQQSSLFVPKQRQTQFQGSQQSGQQGQNSLFIADNQFANWWPQELGMASSSGAQNNIRYAFFPQSRRLALEINGHVKVYDTQDHQIGGVSQQQGGGSSLTFTSQFGLVRVEQLPIISVDGVAPAPNADWQSPPQQQQPPQQQPEQQQPEQQQPEQQAPQPAVMEQPPLDNTFGNGLGNNSGAAPAARAAGSELAKSDIFATIEQLASLRDKGILTDEEFSSKKSELLKRL